MIKSACSWVSEEELLEILRQRHLDPELETAAIISEETAGLFGNDAGDVEAWADTTLNTHASPNLIRNTQTDG